MQTFYNLLNEDTMTIKRIIMDIDEKLHKRIKDCSIRDDRNLNSTIKKSVIGWYWYN